MKQSNNAIRKTALAFALATLFMVAMGAPGVEASTAISDLAFNLVNSLTQANRSAFYIYLDSDSGLNHGFPSGFFASGMALSKIHLDTACVYDSLSPTRCATNRAHIDSQRGTVMRISFDPMNAGEFAGINIEEPERWGVARTGVGYDLRGATQVCFDALSPSANFNVQFGVGGKTSAFIGIPDRWTPVCLTFAYLGLDAASLSNVHLLFTAVTNDLNAGLGGTLLLDNIRVEPVPDSQKLALSFPLANKTVGVLPAADILPGRVPIPPDQVIANLTTIYESAMACIVLIARGTPQDLQSARLIADTFVYALTHDNQGLPLPPATDGSLGPHSGYMSGDVAQYNDQATGGAKKGQIRLAGFSVGSNLCGSSHYCLVLDGATGGNAAFEMLALELAYLQFNDSRYLSAVRTIGNWIYGNLLDKSGTGFGGYYLGYPDQGQPKILQTGKSIENNADIYRAMASAGDIAAQLGLTAESQEWYRRAKIAGDFVIALFAPSGRFYAGTVPVGTPSSPGIQPNGPRKGNDAVNTYDFSDAQTFTTLPLARSLLYRNAIDWRLPVQWMLDHYKQSVSVAGKQYQGFNLVATPTAGPTGVALEFTGQAVVAMKFVDALYGEQRFEAQAQFFLDQIRQSQQSAPFGDGQGVVAAVMQDGDLLPPAEQCLSTPFQCIAQRVGLAATTWAILADNNGLNPFEVLNIVKIPLTVIGVSPSSGPSVGGITVTVTGKGFVDGAAVRFGNSPTLKATFFGSTTLQVTSPPGAGVVAVTVINPNGQSAALSNAFTYRPSPVVTSIQPSQGSNTGGTAVAVAGSGFVTGATLSVGGVAATKVSVVNASTITGLTGSINSVGAFDVVVTNPDGQRGTLSKGFTYTLPAPVISGISPMSGAAAGGTAVIISGIGFVAGVKVRFGNASAAVSQVSANSIQVSTPPGTGIVPVTVTNPDGQTATLPNAFSYQTVTSTIPVITTVAGGGPNPAAATSVALSQPSGGVVDASGNYYVADESHVFRIDPLGQLTVIAGNGSPSYSGDGGPATKAGLNLPNAVALDGLGNLYIADMNNRRVRKVSLNTGVITTVAGNGFGCTASGGGLATKTCLWQPAGVAVESTGNLLIADLTQLWRVSVSTGIIDTVAGTTTQGYAGDGGPAKLAQLNSVLSVRLDRTGNIYIVDEGNSRIRKVTLATGIITTVAGNGATGFAGDGGPATIASLNSPWDTAIDPAGNLYIADSRNEVVRRVAAGTGVITTVAGKVSAFGFGGDGGPATSATLWYPFGLVFDAIGNLYIADYMNHRVRKVLASTGTIGTFAGNGTKYSGGDGGPSTGATFIPSGIAFDSVGNLYVAEDTDNLVRRVDAITGQVSTIAGTGGLGSSGDGGPALNAQLYLPQAVTLDGIGNLYIADLRGTVRRVVLSTGVITTIAGNPSSTNCTDGGSATQCNLAFASGVAADRAGNLFISAQGSNRVYRVQTITGIITLVAGNGTQGFAGDGGLARNGELSGPQGIAVDATGNLFIADTFNNRIRRVDAASGIITTLAGNGVRGFSGDGGPAINAALYRPRGVALDGSGSLYFAEGDGSNWTTGSGNRARRVTLSTGIITTVAGTGNPNFSGDGGSPVAADLYGPSWVAVFGGQLYIADYINRRVRRVTSPGAQPLNISKAHTGTFILGQANATYTIKVSSQAGSGPTSGTVTVTDTLPSGLALVSMSGTGWSCIGNTCTRSDALAGGASYPAITVTVNVASNAPLQVTNQVSVSGGGSPSSAASDPTTIHP